MLPMCYLGHYRGLTRRLESLILTGAEEVNRTPDLLITNQLLYHLSYFGFLPVCKEHFYDMQVICRQSFPEKRAQFTIYKAGFIK